MATKTNTRKTAQVRSRKVTTTPTEAIAAVLTDTKVTKELEAGSKAALQANQLQAVKDYAHYRVTNGRPPKGWDIVHEAWDDDQILEAIGSKCRTTHGAVNKVAGIVALMHANRSELVSA